jgi:hypothetical protein
LLAVRRNGVPDQEAAACALTIKGFANLLVEVVGCEQVFALPLRPGLAYRRWIWRGNA